MRPFFWHYYIIDPWSLDSQCNNPNNQCIKVYSNFQIYISFIIMSFYHMKGRKCMPLLITEYWNHPTPHARAHKWCSLIRQRRRRRWSRRVPIRYVLCSWKLLQVIRKCPSLPARAFLVFVSSCVCFSAILLSWICTSAFN